MSIGTVLLLAVSILIVFGVGQRVLDHLRLNDRMALIIIAAILIGTLIPDIPLGGNIFLNAGGAVIPFALCLYLFFRTDTGGEKFRAIFAALIGGILVFAAGRLLPNEPERMFIDPNYIYGILAGLAAYLLGRSRRAAFIAGVMGVLLADIAQAVINRMNGIVTPVRLGGAGIADAVFISGLLAVLLAEWIGEAREKMQGGTEHINTRFNHGEFEPVPDEKYEIKGASIMRVIKRLAFIITAILVGSVGMTYQVKASFADPVSGYYTVQDVYGKTLFLIAEDVGTDDEYISSDNKLYRIVTVDDAAQKAVAQFVEDVQLDSGTGSTAVQLAAQQGEKVIALYTTHTDESYVPSDGTESQDKGGGIEDVAGALAKNLEDKGVKAVYDNTNHVPHDAGAYRRSRQTAVKLMKDNQPTMLLDIHRDAVPPAEYDKNIKGEDTSAVRIVIGRSNQNKGANEDTAKQIKKIADDKYPGLIKDIFIGKGSYNQDLMPNAILFEVGTHTISKEKAETATTMLADVISTYVGSSGGEQKNNVTGQPTGNAQGQPAPGATGTNPGAKQQGTENKPVNRGSWMGILWAIGLVAVLGAVFLFISTRRGHRGEKFAGYVKEQTGLGKRDKNPEHHDDKDDHQG